MNIKTNRKFKIQPIDFLYYNANPNCDHYRYNPGWGNCPSCLGTIGNSELIGHKAEFETDNLTYSRLKSVTLEINSQFLTCDSKYFTVIEEIK